MPIMRQGLFWWCLLAGVVNSQSFVCFRLASWFITVISSSVSEQDYRIVYRYFGFSPIVVAWRWCFDVDDDYRGPTSRSRPVSALRLSNPGTNDRIFTSRYARVVLESWSCREPPRTLRVIGGCRTLLTVARLVPWIFYGRRVSVYIYYI